MMLKIANTANSKIVTAVKVSIGCCFVFFILLHILVIVASGCE